MRPHFSLEALLTSAATFNVPTATPLQRAICRAVDGRPTGLGAEDLERFFGGTEPTERPTIVELVCGVRSGKSLIAGAAAVWLALTVDLARMPPHERARVAIVAPTVSNASTTFRQLAGAIESSAVLSRLVTPGPRGKPGEVTGDTISIRREDGRTVDIVVLAAHRGGKTVRGVWLAAAILEEVALFNSDGDGYAVSAEELLRAAESRVVPGGQVWIISSPMGPAGLLYDLWREHFGRPGRVLVVRAPTLAMNTVSVSAAMVEAVRKRDPDAAAREYDAEWADADTALFPTAHLERAARKAPTELPREDGHFYAAAMDPATRGNSWTLAVATRRRVGGKLKTSVVLARQWTGSKVSPLSPDTVLREIAAILRGYGVASCATDQHAADQNRDIARRHGLNLWDLTATRASNLEMFESLRTRFADDEIDLPPDAVVRGDLARLRKLVGASVSIDLPRTPDGRHCDYAPAIARAVQMATRNPIEETPPPTLDDIARREKQQAKQRAAERDARKERMYRRDPRQWLRENVR